ncbi:hypothetical protein ACQUW5_08045 [Legionella sp. CNM-1927-20]|uniref:hypothetical protein n=1 Tax=Legionella sp. CNM-1927-20 TaxID=3422221 RepID=UPI00403A83A9
MNFKSKTEAYSYTLSLLLETKQDLNKKRVNSNYEIALSECIEKVKIALENYEQEPIVVANYLKDLEATGSLLSIDKKLQYLFSRLQVDLPANSYQQTVEEKYQNPLARRLESELSIALLLNPTQAMMYTVGRVSGELLKVIDDLEKSGDFTQQRLDKFNEQSNVIAFGAFKQSPSLDEIKKILKENNPNQLIEIMGIHFKFMLNLIREIPLRQAPARKPVGKLAEIIAQFWQGEPKTFFSEGLAKEGKEGWQTRAYISDIHIYKSKLFTVTRDRGRAGQFDKTRTQQLGLLLQNQEQFAVGLPTHSSSWAADCKSQPADYSSPYVLDLIENDAVYVAGPSGMASLLLAQMEMLANFENEELKKNYLSAIVAYIVGGGFHSIHEVVGPAADSLELVPGYNITAPKPKHLAPPPNYHQFFAQQAVVDPEFAGRRELGWQNYLAFFNHHYAPYYIEDFQSMHFREENLSIHNTNTGYKDNSIKGSYQKKLLPTLGVNQKNNLNLIQESAPDSLRIGLNTLLKQTLDLNISSTSNASIGDYDYRPK